MNTGEDAQGLRKIVDFTRFISVVILGIHFYSYCYEVFDSWGLTAEIRSPSFVGRRKVPLSSLL
ncbi:YWFCY domain-containing protein [Pedobacter sp.]|uniref:YWFCY domain-containing protein n=1 Tax=Pedobacter sp. TaxID=1411316 RepID=UPI003BACFF0A